MSNNLPPLSGAILISNPKKDTAMASALQNPNNRRTVNIIARYAVKEGVPAEKAAEMWFSERNKSSESRKISRTSMYGPAETRGASFKAAYGSPKGIPKLSAADKKARSHAYAKAKRQAAKKLGELYGYDKKRTGKYVQAVIGGQGARYLSKAKKTFAMGSGFRAGKKNQKVSEKGVREWNHNRVARRAAGEWGHAHGQDPRPQRQNIAFSKKHPEAVGRAKNSLARFGGIKRAQPEVWSMKPSKRAEMGAEAPRAGRGRGRRSAARNNPMSALGDLALTNPSMAGAKQYLLAYAIPVTIAGGAAGAVHAFAASKGVTEKISEYAEKVPVVGRYLAMAPFTIQGTIVGTALVLAGKSMGGKIGEQIALAGGAAIVFGGGIDAFNALRDRLGMGDLALTNESALGDLAFTNMGDLAFTNMGELGFTEGSSVGDLAFTNESAPMGDGFAYMTAPLTADVSMLSYGQASLHDAYYSGADFSESEGQALLNGPQDFVSRFGAPPHRMGGQPNAHSHLAGRDGHRWGWLVKMVGWPQAQRIAALPPKQRVAVLRKIRAAALSAAKEGQLLSKAQELAHQADMAPAASDLIPAAGMALAAPGGANGPGSSNMGDLFAGDDYGATLFAQA